jgi:hypothetical protein
VSLLLACNTAAAVAQMICSDVSEQNCGPETESATHIFSRTMPLAWEAPTNRRHVMHQVRCKQEQQQQLHDLLSGCQTPASLSAASLNMQYNDHQASEPTCEGLLPLRAQMALLVVLVCPPLVTAVDLELTPSSHTTCLTA